MGGGGGGDLYTELEFYRISGVGLRQSITFREDELRSLKPDFHNARVYFYINGFFFTALLKNQCILLF